MKAYTITFIAVLFCHLTIAQNVLIDKKAVAHFYSDAPIEDIEATNEEAIGAMDIEKGTVAVSMLIRNFHFEKSLMEEHFNENYMESEKFPKASFKGRILDFSSIDFDEVGSFTAQATGELDIHGISKPVTSDVTFDVTDSQIIAKTMFKVKLEDHDIKIPKLVVKKIAEVVDVDVTFTFNKN